MGGLRKQRTCVLCEVSDPPVLIEIELSSSDSSIHESAGDASNKESSSDDGISTSSLHAAQQHRLMHSSHEQIVGFK